MDNPDTDEEIGSVRVYGETIRVFKRYEGSRQRFHGYVLQGQRSIEVAPGKSVYPTVYIPRSGVDRLCGLLQADLAAEERSEQAKIAAASLRKDPS